jgi:hypothetical protein
MIGERTDVWRTNCAIVVMMRTEMVLGTSVSPPKPCIHLSPPPYVPHAQPISFFLIFSLAKHWVSSWYVLYHNFGGPGNSVRIVTGYGLDGPGIESQWGTRFSALVQTGPGAHPASCTTGTGSFSGGKERPGRDADLSPPSSAVVMKE